MKKVMVILALAGLMVGCAHNRGGTQDQSQMNSGADSNAPASQTSTNGTTGSQQ